MKPKANSNRFEISNRFEMSFRLQGNLHAHFMHMCRSYLLINADLINTKNCYQWWLLIDASLINAKQMLRYWLLFKQW